MPPASVAIVIPNSFPALRCVRTSFIMMFRAPSKRLVTTAPGDNRPVRKTSQMPPRAIFASGRQAIQSWATVMTVTSSASGPAEPVSREVNQAHTEQSYTVEASTASPVWISIGVLRLRFVHERHVNPARLPCLCKPTISWPCYTRSTATCAGGSAGAYSVARELMRCSDDDSE